MARISTRDAALALDAADPLAPLRDEFVLPEGVIYLDGNSLGALPARTAARVRRTIDGEWGEGLIRSWNDAGWIDAGAARSATRSPALIGAGPGEVSVGDSTSVNLFKVLSRRGGAAEGATRRAARPSSRERSNFPTDLYIAESVAARGWPDAATWSMPSDLADQLDRTTARADADARQLPQRPHARHGRDDARSRMRPARSSSGTWRTRPARVPVDLHGADADFAVGCGYKYLNGGPGAPAFVWAHPRHTRGWTRRPAPAAVRLAGPRRAVRLRAELPAGAGIGRFLCGTPPILALRALRMRPRGLRRGATRYGGMAALRAKSMALDRSVHRAASRSAAPAAASSSRSPRDARRARQPGRASPHRATATRSCRR